MIDSQTTSTSDQVMFFFAQVECKKAQPKEVVQAANTAALLGKRVILSNLGMVPSLTMLPQLSPAAPQPLTTPSLQAALQQQLAASLGIILYIFFASSLSKEYGTRSHNFIYQLMFTTGSSRAPKFSITDCSSQQRYKCFPSSPHLKRGQRLTSMQ
jgi:hypothetical protein